MTKASRRAFLVAFSLTALTLLSWGASQPSPVEAATTCGSPALSFDGFWTYPTQQPGLEGASSKIRVGNAALCPNSSNGNTSSVWTMITEDQSHRSNSGLAQVGFWISHENPTLDPYYFYEGAESGAGLPTTWHGALGVGVTHRFWVQWVTSECPSPLSGCFAYNIDSTRIATSNFDPYSYWGDPADHPWDIQLFAETHFPGTDVAGDNSGFAVVHTESLGQNWTSNNFSGVSCTMGASNSNSRYGLNYASNNGCGAWSTYTY